MIEFKNISFAYGNDNPVLKGIGLVIKAGEDVAIIGANGSGKTTLALLINGILKPSAGEIRICGLNPAEEKAAVSLKQKVGIVFQKPDNQLVSSTVEREVAFTLENFNIPRDEMRERVMKALDLMGLTSLKDRSTSELSGGEKQRLALASVIVARPEILILDEPGAFLDETGKRQLSVALEKLKSDNPGLTLIRITQFAYIARQYFRLVALNNGEVVYDGQPDTLFKDIQKCHQIGIDIPLANRLYSLEFHTNSKPPLNTENQKPDHTIRLDNLEFSYIDTNQDFRLHDVNLSIKNGVIYGLVGPSGSGKSTLLNIIGRLNLPLRGKIEYDGFKPEQGRIAISFQEPERQFFLETVEKELKFGPQNLGFENIEEIAQDACLAVGLDIKRFMSRDPFTLSGGEKRRLALGILVALRPDFVLFDEPTCALDASGMEAFRNLVRYFHNQGAGIIIVSHHGDTIFEMAERIIHLENGRIIGEYGKEEFFLKDEYSSFLSVPQMVSFQKSHFGEIRYFDETSLALALSRPADKPQ